MDEIKIPDQISEITIFNLELNGKINEPEEQRIKSLLPDTELWINGKAIY